MDPKHRNRIAFLRICSGKFERGSNYYHTRQDKKFRISQATAFMAQDKYIIDEAYPGDIIGLYDTGNFKIGDTLTLGEKGMYRGIPSFSPEIFRRGNQQGCHEDQAVGERTEPTHGRRCGPTLQFRIGK